MGLQDHSIQSATKDMSCPNCNDLLPNHTNDQIQQCVFNELQKLGVDND